MATVLIAADAEWRSFRGPRGTGTSGRSDFSGKTAPTSVGWPSNSVPGPWATLKAERLLPVSSASLQTDSGSRLGELDTAAAELARDAPGPRKSRPG